MSLINSPPRVPAAILGPRRLVEDDLAANALGGSLLAGASDPDFADVLRVASVAGITGGAVAGRYGLLTWNATTGAYSYALDNSLAAVQALGAGVTVRERFDVVVADRLGATAATRLLIDVGGANDAPKAKPVAAALTEDAAISIATGNLLAGASDVDRGDVLRIASINGITTGAVNGKFGVLGWNAATGGYTYTLDNARPATDALKAYAFALERFRFVVEDGKGGSAEATLTVTVNGANDAPRSPGLALAVTEGTTTAPDAPRALDLLAGATDPEKDVVLVAGVGGLTAAGSVQGLYGTLVWNGSGGASYMLDNTFAATNALKAGQVAQDVFGFTLSDRGGAQRSAAITVTVTGTNDAPADAGASLAAAEQGTASGIPTLYQANLLAGATDPDGDPLTVIALAGLTDPGTVQGTHGTLIWAGDGTAAYQVTSKALKPGQVAEERFAYTVADGQGGTASADLVVTVIGVNDAPDALTQAGSVTVGLRPQMMASGNLLTGATDPEGDPVALLSIDAGALGTTLPTTYGTLRVSANGAYTYSLNPTRPVYVALPAGSSGLETFAFTVSDGQGGTDRAELRITVTGRNEGPTIIGTTTGAVAEDGVLTAAGQLTITDPDTGEARFRTPSSLAGTYGSFAFDPLTGAWGYTLNNASAKVQALYDGQTVQDRLDVVSLDGTAGRTITVSIAGQGPVLAVTADTLFGTEGQTLFFGFGASDGTPAAETLLSNDLSGEGSPIVLGGVFELRYGLLVLDPSGAVAYTPNDPNFTGRDDFDYTIRDAAGGEATGHVAIFIQNVPDPLPVLQLGDLAARGDGYRILGGTSDYGVGWSLAGHGDFNGDGRADIAIGGFGSDNAGTYFSSPYVVFGQAAPADVDLGFLSGLGTTSSATINAVPLGVKIGDEPLVRGPTGLAFSWLGDLNGDGRDDLAVLSGATVGSVPLQTGVIDVLFGRTPTTPIALGSDPPPGGGFRILFPADLNYVQQMTTAGDVNGDGLADLLVGMQARNGNAWSGASFVVFGKADQAPVDLGTLAVSGDGFRISGPFVATSYDEAFAADVIAAPGDVNGDGLDDLLISSVGLGVADSIVSVVFGKTGSAAVDLAGFDALGQGYRIATGGWVTQLAGLGDINGDGLADFALGGIHAGMPGGALATIVYGKADSAAMDLTTIGPGAGGFRITDTTGKLSGVTTTVSAVGDLNHDGRDDLFLSTPGAVFSVGPSVFTVTGAVVFSPGNGADVDMAQVVQGIGGFLVAPEAGANGSARTATRLGDVNGDGFDDLGIGMPGTNRAYVIYGDPAWAVDTPIL